MSSAPTSNDPPGPPRVLGRAGRSSVIGADGQFEELRAFVDRAQSGDIDLDGADHLHGKLPSGWYAPLLPEAPPWRVPPEVLAGALGLAAGFVLLIPLALWWQYVPPPSVASVAPPAAMARSEAASTRIDIVPVRTLPVVRPVDSEALLAEVRSLLSFGEVAAARALLASAVADRQPDALFLMAESYDPYVLASRGVGAVEADPEHARSLYAAAVALGHMKARDRLQAFR